MFHTNVVTETRNLFVFKKCACIIERYSVTSFQSIFNMPVAKKDVFPLVHTAVYIYHGKFIEQKQRRANSVNIYCCKTKHCPFHNEPFENGEEHCIILPGECEHSLQCKSLGFEPINK